MLLRYFTKKQAYCFIAACTLLFMGGGNALAQSKTVNTSEFLEDFIPLTLNRDTTIIYLADYFTDPNKIDSIQFDKAITWQRRKDNTVQVIAKENLPTLSTMKLWVGGVRNEVLLKKSKKEYYTFTFDAKGKAYKTVQLAGEMNDWTPKKSAFEQQKDGSWKLRILLNPGVYQYQIVLDDKWGLDPANPDSADNNNGGFNSVFKAGNSDVKKQPLLSTVGFDDAKHTITIKVAGKIDPSADLKLFAFLQNQRLKIEKKADVYVIYFTEFTNKTERCFIRIYGCNIFGEGNSLLIPLKDGKVIVDAKLLDRNYKEANSMYFVLVDRFNNGDSTNDKKVVHPDIKPKANYYGGDLQGVYNKINDGYFDSLHVNTLWISPILQNPETAFKEFPEPHDWYSGYHGYWPISLNTIDHRFGNDEVFKNVVNKAHTHGINVLIDLVANHVHEDYPLIKQHPEWRTMFDLPDGRKNIRLWDEYRLTTWFDNFLPTLDFNNPQVLRLEVDSSVYWVDKFGIDGFRHDATKHIPEKFWRALTLDLKKKIEYPQHRTLYQLGETYGSKELVSSYIGSGMMDGQFDFNLYFDARSAFAKDGEGFEKLAVTLQQSLATYGSHHLMGNISGNHDIPRFISLAGGALSFSEDARKAGWDHTVGVGNLIAYKKLAALHAFNATIPGVPVIYYGDEIGLPGAGDPDNRRMMRFDNLLSEEALLKEKVSKLMKLRAEHLALTYGEFELLRADKEVLMYQRHYFDETIFVVFNNSVNDQLIVVPALEIEVIKGKYTGAFGHELNLNQGTQRPTASVQLPAKSFDVFIFNSKK